jgi:hypothetical protein
MKRMPISTIPKATALDSQYPMITTMAHPRQISAQGQLSPNYSPKDRFPSAAMGSKADWRLSSKFLIRAAVREAGPCAYAHAIADDQHADHQLRTDRGATGAAVERLQRLAEVIEVEMPVNVSQHVIGREVGRRGGNHRITGLTSLERPSSPHPPPHRQKQ